MLSGMDATTGATPGEVIKVGIRARLALCCKAELRLACSLAFLSPPRVHTQASVTLALGLPKSGTVGPAVGRLLLGDVGIPRQAMEAKSLQLCCPYQPPFGKFFYVPISLEEETFAAKGAESKAYGAGDAKAEVKATAEVCVLVAEPPAWQRCNLSVMFG